MGEVLQYASPPPVVAKARSPWLRLLKVLGLLVGEIACEVILVSMHVELLGALLAIVIVLTALVAAGLLLACLVPTPHPTLSLPERRTLIGECARCGYDVRYLPGARCPECGWLIPLRESILCWPDPAGPREQATEDYTDEVQAYLREVMRYRPPFASDRWNDDPARAKLVAELSEAFRAGNELNSDHFIPEDSFAVATLSLGAHFAALQILDRYIDDVFRRDVIARLRSMTLDQVIDFALAPKPSARVSH